MCSVFWDIALETPTSISGGSFHEQYGYLVLENEANEFARSLLLPNHEFTMSVYINVDKRNVVDMEKLEELFQVPKEHIRLQGERIGVFIEKY